MKFLQRNKGRPEANQLPGSPRRKRKRDQAHAKEEEISAYFTSVRPALVEQNSKIQAKEGSHQKLQGNSCSERERSSVRNAILTVEPADKVSCLGFGDRGPQHESESYISWSESIRPPSTTPACLRLDAVGSTSQLGSKPDGQEAGNTLSGKMLHSRPAPPTVTPHLTNDNGGRFQVSSLPLRSDRISRSQSLPQQTSSPHRINLVDRAARRRALDTAASPSSMPPFVSTHSDHRHRQNYLRRVPAVRETRDHSVFIQKPELTRPRVNHPKRKTQYSTNEESNQQTSSSLGHILQDCNTAFHKRRKGEGPRAYCRGSSPDVPVQSILRSNSQLCAHIRTMPTVRFADVERVDRSKAPALYGPSIYGQQEQRQFHVAPQTLHSGYVLPSHADLQDGYFGDEELNCEEEAREEEAELEVYDFDLPMMYEPNPQQVEDTFAENTYGMRDRGNGVAKPGFWRPHKLY